MNIAEREQQILRVEAASFHPHLDAALAAQLRANVILTVQSTLEAALVEEVEAARAKMSVPPRRSGYYPRVLDTQYGRIADLHVPKLRNHNQDREWRILTRYERQIGDLLAYAGYLYVMGLSLRDLQAAFYFLLRQVLSTAAINRVTLQVQEKLDQERLKKITRTPVALIVDGVWVSVQYTLDAYKVDKAGHRRQQRHAQDRVILCVMAVYADGTHHILHYEIAEDEDAYTWSTVLENLIARGLDPQHVKLVVSDGTKGLLTAMAQWLPTAQQQRCITHKVRGMQRQLTYQDLPSVDTMGQPLSPEQAKHQRWQQLKTAAYAIYEAPTKAAARAQLATFEAEWQAREPKAVHTFLWGIQRTFTFYAFDKALHGLIRTTNALERFFREFRAKADEIGAFPNETSCLTVFLLVVSFDHARHERIPVANNS